MAREQLYEYWYDCANLKYEDHTKLFFTDIGCFIVYVKSEDVYADLTAMLKRDLIHQTIKLRDYYP